MSADSGPSGDSGRTRPDLNALLGSRICHDLISPLGAISNGVELLSMSGLSAAPEIALITESVEAANARIRFYRIAFGAAAPGQSVALSEIRHILDDIARGGRLTYRWDPEQQLDRRRVKFAFLVLMCLESAMPFGGSITVEGGSGEWTATGSSERLKIDPGLWELLVTPISGAEVTPANVHFALAAEAARHLAGPVSTELGNTRIRIEF